MKIENLVTSLELAKLLKELGVKQESFLLWNVCEKIRTDHPPARRLGREEDFDYCADCSTVAAFTVTELGVALRHQSVSSYWQYDEWIIADRYGEIYASGKTEADARAAAVILFINDKRITVETVNSLLAAA